MSEAKESKGKLDQPLSLDTPLDDIEDLPGFVVFPTGAYSVVLEEGMNEKEINDQPALEVPMKLVEILEMTEVLKEGEAPPMVGDVCTISFMLDNKFGVGKMKEFLSPSAKALNVRTIAEVRDQSKGLALMVVIKRTYDDKKDRHYANFKKVSLL